MITVAMSVKFQFLLLWFSNDKISCRWKQIQSSPHLPVKEAMVKEDGIVSEVSETDRGLKLGLVLAWAGWKSEFVDGRWLRLGLLDCVSRMGVWICWWPIARERWRPILNFKLLTTRKQESTRDITKWHQLYLKSDVKSQKIWCTNWGSLYLSFYLTNLPNFWFRRVLRSLKNPKLS